MKWPVEPLVNVCQIMMGQAPAGTSYNDAEKGVPLVAGAGDFNGTVPKVHKYTTAPSKVSNVGDIILGIRASIGEKVWSDQTYCLGRGVAGLRVKSNLSPWFLWYWLGLAKKELLSKARGATFLQVNRKDIESLQIPLPPLSEQKRIAKILDAADALRAKRRESLALLDDLTQSIFLDMFGDPVTNPMGWEMGVIGDLLESVNYGSSKKADPESGAYPILRMNNITYSGEWNFKNLKYIDLNEKDVGKYLVYKGQLLFNRTNSKELVGKTAVYRQEKPMAFAGYLVRGIVNKLADAEYIGTFMNTPQLKTYLQNKCKNIVGMANINAKEFQLIPIPKPPLHLQQRFASIVESIEKQKERLKAQLSQMDTLFASLQQRAFQGEL